MGRQRQAVILEAAARELNDELTVIMGSCEDLLTGLPANDPMQVELNQIQVAATRIQVISTRLLVAASKGGAKAASISLEQAIHGMG